MVIALTACSTDENANASKYELDLNKLSEREFTEYMDAYAVDNDIVNRLTNTNLTNASFTFNSVLSDVKNGDLGLGVRDTSLGSCLESNIVVGDEVIGTYDISKVANPNDPSIGNFEIDFAAADGWFISRIYMNVSEDCNTLPKFSNGRPDVCSFNVRNSFGIQRTDVKYNFSGAHLDAPCYCLSNFLVMYTLKSNGQIDRCIGAWVDGSSIAGSPVGKTNTFCKSECGETIFVDN